MHQHTRVKPVLEHEQRGVVVGHWERMGALCVRLASCILLTGGSYAEVDKTSSTFWDLASERLVEGLKGHETLVRMHCAILAGRPAEPSTMAVLIPAPLELILSRECYTFFNCNSDTH